MVNGYLTVGEVGHGLTEGGRCVQTGEGSARPHHLRHAYAGRAVEKGVEILDLQKLLGHADLNTLAAYYDQNNAKLRATNVGAMHPERAWILSDRDVWYRNPSYHGPAVPHPDDYEAMMEAQ